MAAGPTRFTDGAGYERFMGRWSRLAGETFLDWLALPAGLRVLDVGCGNGCFTELLAERSAPAELQAVDPSEGQLAFARERPGASAVEFREGDAQALPFDNDAFDAAVMALVINLIPDRAKAVAEMARVVRPGGWVASYMWDIPGGGFTMEPIRKILDGMGVPTPIFGAEFTSIEPMRKLWREAALADVAARRIDVQMDFDGFDDFWDAFNAMPNSVANAIGTLSEAEVEDLKEKLRAELPAGADGRIAYDAFASAVKGRKPAG